MLIISNIVSTNNIKPVIRDGRIINLKVVYYPTLRKNKNISYYVEFRDSYLLLTTSLENLGNTFALNKNKLEKKLPFPYKFINEANVDFSYVGPFPDFKFYDKISETEYNQIINKFRLNGKPYLNEIFEKKL